MLERPAEIKGTAPVLNPGSQRPELQRDGSRESLSAFFSSLRQRRKTLAAVLVLVPLCAYLTLRQITPSYTATGSLIYDPSEYKVRELQSILRADPTTEAMMSSQAEIFAQPEHFPEGRRTRQSFRKSRIQCRSAAARPTSTRSGNDAVAVRNGNRRIAF